MRSWWDLGEHIGQLGESLALYQIECPFCEERGNFLLEHHSEKKKPNGNKILNFDTYKCGSCSSFVMVLWSVNEHRGSRNLHSYRVLPYPLKITKAPDYMPEAVGRNWLQAQKSLESESWDAAAIMARTAMQTALRDKQATGNHLIDEINDLATQGVLPPLMVDWAHEVRILGNEGTHQDPMSTGVEDTDAKDIVEYLDYLLEYLYALPQKIQAYRDRRNPDDQEEDE